MRKEVITKKGIKESPIGVIKGGNYLCLKGKF